MLFSIFWMYCEYCPPLIIRLVCILTDLNLFKYRMLPNLFHFLRRLCVSRRFLIIFLSYQRGKLLFSLGTYCGTDLSKISFKLLNIITLRFFVECIKGTPLEVVGNWPFYFILQWAWFIYMLIIYWVKKCVKFSRSFVTAWKMLKRYWI